MADLRTARLCLRRWRPSDHEPFAAMNLDPRVTEFLPTPLDRYASDALVARVEAHFEKHGFGLWAVEIRETGSFAGYVGLQTPTFEASFTPCVEIGWRLAPESWGKGYATEGALAVIDYGFTTLGLKEILSWTVPANVRSQRVMTKLGMTHDPKDDFDHPLLPEGHPLRRHVLYRKFKGAESAAKLPPER
jgi:RimJ/RimL family protein N-acetyltransferase